MNNSDSNAAAKPKSRFPLMGYHVEIDSFGRETVFFCSEVRGVREFSEEKAVLRVKGSNIFLKGSSMKIKTLEGHGVEICGKITEVIFSNAKDI